VDDRAGYLGFVLLLTWQALRGQSIVAPDPATLAAAAGLLAGAASVAVVITANAAEQRARFCLGLCRPLPSSLETRGLRRHVSAVRKSNESLPAPLPISAEALPARPRSLIPGQHSTTRRTRTRGL
jgi:hypothetical protein